MKVECVYWDFGGRAQPIRDAAKLAKDKVEFIDTRLSREEWAAKKASVPCQALPYGYVHDGDKKTLVAQSNALLVLVGRLGGLYPTDVTQAAVCDSVLGIVEDLIGALAPSIREPDEAKKIELRKGLVAGKLPMYVKALTDFLGDRDFFCGELSVADLKVNSVVDFLTSGHLDGIPKDIAGAKLEALHARVKAKLAE